MAFWQEHINPETGRPFNSEGEFNDRAVRIHKERGPAIDYIMAQLEQKYPELNRKATRIKLAKFMAAYQDMPSDPDAIKNWGKGFMDMMQVYNWSELQEQAQRAGWTPEKQKADPNGFAQWSQKNAQPWLGSTRDTGLFAGQVDSLDVALGLQSEEDTDGSISGKGDKGDYNKRMQLFREALYNPQVAQRLGGIAAEQSARGSYAAGVRGPAAPQGIAQAVTDSQMQYDQAVNAQALQLMGIENAHEANAAQLALQNRQFNAGLLAQQQQQRQQTGGTIGGIIGGVVGSIPALFPGGQGVAAITAPAAAAIGTGIGSVAAGAGGGRAGGSLGSSARKGSGGISGV